MSAADPVETRAALKALLARCTPENSSEDFRAEVERAIRLLDEDEDAAARCIGNLAANVSGRVSDEPDGMTHYEQTDNGVIEVPIDRFRADEEQTDAYYVLSDLRFRFGYQWRRVHPNNIVIYTAR